MYALLYFFSLNCKIRLSISFITILNSLSDFPVGSSSRQFSSNVLPIKGNLTLHPIEIAMSGLGILESNLEYCVFPYQFHIALSLFKQHSD